MNITNKQYLFTTSQDDEFVAHSNLFAKIFLNNNTITSNGIAYDIMVQKNYLTKNKNSSDSDIHNQFMDFVINIALFHKSFDESSNKVTHMDEVKQIVSSVRKQNPKVFNDINNFINVTLVNLNRGISVYSIDALNRLINNLIDAIMTPAMKSVLQHLTINQVAVTTALQAQLRVGIMTIIKTTKKHYVNRTIFNNIIFTFFGNTLNKSKSTTDLINLINKIIKSEITKYYTPSHSHSTLANRTQLTMWQNVYKNWNNHTPKTKQFYKRYLNFLTLNNNTNTWVPIPEHLYTQHIDQSNYQNYRINLLKSVNGETVFSSTLPNTPTSSKYLFYTNASNQIVKLPITNPQIIKTLYNKTYSTNTIRTSPTRFTEFNLDIDNIVKNYMFSIVRPQSQTRSQSQSQSQRYGFLSLFNNPYIWPYDYNFQSGGGTDYSHLIEADVWSIKNNKFIKHNKQNNTTIEYGPADQTTKNALTVNNTCYSSLINTDNASCQDHMFNCLLNNDKDSMKKCIASLKTKNFTMTSKAEIAKLHPLTVLRTLEALGFQKQKQYTQQYGQSLIMIESVDKWNNKAKFATNDYKYVKEYINLLVQFVNKNPKLLNYQYHNQPSSTLQYKPVGSTKSTNCGAPTNYQRMCNYIRGQRQLLFNIQQPRLMLNTSNIYPLHMLNIKRTPVMHNVTKGTYYKPNNLTLSPDTKPLFRLYGGNMERKNSGIKLIKNLFDEALKELKSNNKELTKQDITRINKQISYATKLEKNLIDQLTIVETYNELLKLFPNHKSEILSLQNLDMFIGAQQNTEILYKKQEDRLMSIIDSLQKIFNESR